MASFEQPLHERIRLLLRIQQLFLRLDYHLEKDNSFDTHCVITLLIDLMDLANRSDVKRELMKELESQHMSLQEEGDLLVLADETWEALRSRQSQLLAALHEHQGSMTQHLKSCEFLNCIRQRGASTGSICSHDAPLYHRWLSQPNQDCLKDLRRWLAPFQAFRDSIDLCLHTIRRSRTHIDLVAERGFFQQSLNGGKGLKLIIVEVDDTPPIYPEISAGKLRISIRFMHFDNAHSKPVQCLEDIPFTLTQCGL